MMCPEPLQWDGYAADEGVLRLGKGPSLSGKCYWQGIFGALGPDGLAREFDCKRKTKEIMVLRS